MAAQKKTAGARKAPAKPRTRKPAQPKAKPAEASPPVEPDVAAAAAVEEQTSPSVSEPPSEPAAAEPPAVEPEATSPAAEPELEAEPSSADPAAGGEQIRLGQQQGLIGNEVDQTPNSDHSIAGVTAGRKGA